MLSAMLLICLIEDHVQMAELRYNTWLHLYTWKSSNLPRTYTHQAHTCRNTHTLAETRQWPFVNCVKVCMRGLEAWCGLPISCPIDTEDISNAYQQQRDISSWDMPAWARYTPRGFLRTRTYSSHWDTWSSEQGERGERSDGWMEEGRAIEMEIALAQCLFIYFTGGGFKNTRYGSGLLSQF